MKKRTMRSVIFLIGTLCLFAGTTSTADDIQDVCTPPAGSESPFAGLETNWNHVAANCVSAYPRVDDWQIQGQWETAVAKRCQSIYRLRHTGEHKETYREACIAVERDFRKKTARWPDERKPVERVKRPVCASAFGEGSDGEKLYACSIYFSSEKYSGPAKPLSDNAIVIEN